MDIEDFGVFKFILLKNKQNKLEEKTQSANKNR